MYHIRWYVCYICICTPSQSINCLPSLLGAGNGSLASVATVDIVVSIATHVPDSSIASSHSAVPSIGKSVCDGNGAKVGQSRKVAVTKRDGLDDPFGVDLAQRAG